MKHTLLVQRDSTILIEESLQLNKKLILDERANIKKTKIDSVKKKKELEKHKRQITIRENKIRVIEDELFNFETLNVNTVMNIEDLDFKNSMYSEKKRTTKRKITELENSIEKVTFKLSKFKKVKYTIEEFCSQAKKTIDDPSKVKPTSSTIADDNLCGLCCVNLKDCAHVSNDNGSKGCGYTLCIQCSLRIDLSTCPQCRGNTASNDCYFKFFL